MGMPRPDLCALPEDILHAKEPRDLPSRPSTPSELRAIAQKRAPALAQRPMASDHVLRDGQLSDFEDIFSATRHECVRTPKRARIGGNSSA